MCNCVNKKPSIGNKPQPQIQRQRRLLEEFSKPSLVQFHSLLRSPILLKVPLLGSADEKKIGRLPTLHRLG